LFDFDKAEIRADGRAALNKFASDLNGVRYDSIKVTGHTDRLGPRAYNQKLSERRAQAVSAYLASTGIPTAKLNASGADGADPVTKPGQCVGTRPTAQLIACLQPDRRVVVEITGTR